MPCGIRLLMAAPQGCACMGGGGVPRVCVHDMVRKTLSFMKFHFFSKECSIAPQEVCVGGGGGVGTRPQYLIVCLWRRLLASRHCSF